MKFVGSVSVLPRIPDSIGRLPELANNLWWSWHPNARYLFARLDPELWDAVNHNPVKMLREISQQALDGAAADEDYVSAYADVMAEFDSYMDPGADTWYKRHHGDVPAPRPEGSRLPAGSGNAIAYFSAEFGLHEALPIYSGGLGVLSGDHCKAASDMGLPFIGVGFLYPQGYFTQVIDPHGTQIARYNKIDLSEVPATPALDAHGREVLVSVDLPGRTVFAKVWRLDVGRVKIYLLDTDVPRNAPQDRELSARLYGGDREVRICQEIVLGIGGVRAVRALGYDPAVWHMNEGHSAFLGLERICELVVGSGLTFDEAVEVVRSNTLFTTHTPVPAGNDAFSFELIDKFFWQWWGQLGIDRERFIDFAKQDLDWGPQYSMTVLALRLSGYHNGVSELHGRVSRQMWQFLWPETPVYEVPIGHITNGVHTGTWLPGELNALYGSHLPNGWKDHLEQPDTWRAIDDIPDAELWQIHRGRKRKLVDHVRRRVRKQLIRHGEGARRLRDVDSLLDPDALIIGFARRFATYKRSTLLFRDEERIQRIMSDPERPVQFVFAGKAHPDDEPGKDLIRRIYELSRRPEFEGKLIFVEDYDMNLARDLVSGADVWLNTPRRPREASGTSGQKAALCGVPNFSVLDGWWAEGFDGTNGWAIPAYAGTENRAYKDEHTQDDADADSMYHTLEQEIIPLFYDRNQDGVPSGWLRVMKSAIKSCAPEFSMRRMLIDYVEDYYVPAAGSGEVFLANGYGAAKDLAAWKNMIDAQWHSVHIQAGRLNGQAIQVDEALDLTATVRLPDGMTSDDVTVEAVYGRHSEPDRIEEPVVVTMDGASGSAGEIAFHGSIAPAYSGNLVVGVRVRPSNPLLIDPFETGKMHWA